MKEKIRGNLTVFLSIFLPFFILFLGILTDITRMKTASNRLEEGLYSSVESLMTCYQERGKEDYGLFIVNREEESIFYDMLSCNVGDILIDSEITYTHPLSDKEVLKEQILEDIKIRGLINIGKDFMEKLDVLKELDTEDAFEGLGESKEDLSNNLQKEVGDNMVLIKELEERRSEGEEGLDGQIEELYEKNRELLLLAEDLSGEKEPEEDKEDLLNEGLNKLKDTYGDGVLEAPDPLETFYENKEEVEGNFLEEAFINIRNTLLIDEYILEHFENMGGGGSGEVEQILHGENYVVPAVGELFLSRFLLDSVGYLTMDPKAPPEGISRLIYSLVGGLATGIYDTAELLVNEEGEVPLIHIEPQGATPLEKIDFSYKNHLQLLMLFKSEDTKLNGIYSFLKKDLGEELYTGVRGEGSASIDLLFLKYLPEGTQILDGEVRGGKFYVEKEVEKIY